MAGSVREGHPAIAPVEQGAVALTPSEGANASSDEEVEKKSAWNRISNGSVDAGTVMGAKSWPLLSESSKVSPKSPSSELLSHVTEGSGQESTGTLTSKQSTRPTSSKTPSGTAPIRQQSYQRVGSGAGSSTSILPNSDPATPPPSFKAEAPPPSSGRNSVSTDPPRDPSNRNSGNWERGSRSGGLSPQAGRNENYRGYGGGHRRGNNGGGPHNKFGNRREQDRGNDWNLHPNMFVRGMQMPQQHQQRPFPRPMIQVPLPGPPPFINPPSPVPLRPYMVQDMCPPMLYIPAPPTPPPDLYASLPYATSPTMFYPTPEHQSSTELAATLLGQIHYYFSTENLCKDIFLRQNMDEEGWVPISLIASFNRVKNLTTDLPFIWETVRGSSILEVQEDKIRRRNDWKTFILHSPRSPPSTISPSSINNLLTSAMAAQVKSMGLANGASHHQLPAQGSLSSGELGGQSR